MAQVVDNGVFCQSWTGIHGAYLCRSADWSFGPSLFRNSSTASLVSWNCDSLTNTWLTSSHLEGQTTEDLQNEFSLISVREKILDFFRSSINQIPTIETIDTESTD